MWYSLGSSQVVSSWERRRESGCLSPEGESFRGRTQPCPGCPVKRKPRGHASVLLVSFFFPSHARSSQAEAGSMGTLDVVWVRSALEQRAGWRSGSEG